MATVSKEAYLRLVENHPYKFDTKEVNYREGEDEDVCRTCVHLYERVTDKFYVCEIYRPESEDSIDPEFTCDFHNALLTSEPSSTTTEN